MRTVKITDTEFTVREGNWGVLSAPWGDGLGVAQMTKGKCRLTYRKVDKAWLSAGIEGPSVLPGFTYVLETTGRFDQLDPRTIFAVWTRNDKTEEEVDVLESTRWGDVNSPNLYHIGYFSELIPATDEGPPTQTSTHQTAPSKSYRRHRISLTRSVDNKAFIKIEGQLLDGRWYELTNGTYDMRGDHKYRIAMWLYKDGPAYVDSLSIGPKYVTLDSFRIIAPLTKV